MCIDVIHATSGAGEGCVLQTTAAAETGTSGSGKGLLHWCGEIHRRCRSYGHIINKGEPQLKISMFCTVAVASPYAFLQPSRISMAYMYKHKCKGYMWPKSFLFL